MSGTQQRLYGKNHQCSTSKWPFTIDWPLRDATFGRLGKESEFQQLTWRGFLNFPEAARMLAAWNERWRQTELWGGHSLKQRMYLRGYGTPRTDSQITWGVKPYISYIYLHTHSTHYIIRIWRIVYIYIYIRVVERVYIYSRVCW